MGVLFSASHEGVALTEWDSSATDSGDLSTSTEAGIIGSCGLDFNIDDSNHIYVDYNFLSAPSTNKLRYSFCLNADNLTIDSGENMWINRVRIPDSPYAVIGVRLENDGTNNEITLRFYDDDGNHYGSAHDVSSGSHYVEVYVIRATTNSASDASASIWIDGTFKEEITGKDLYDNWDNINIFRIMSRDAGVNSGSLYMDEVIVNDDGSEIGEPGQAAVGIIQMAINQYRRRRVYG